MKRILSICFLVFITIIANAGNRNLRGVIVIGLEGTYAPFNWTETRPSPNSVPKEFRNHPINGSLSWFGRGLYANGYDVWVSRQIANDLGKKLVIEQIVWEGLVPALQFGHIDLIVAGMTPTPARAEVINFSDEYHEVRNVPVVRKDGLFANATNYTDLDGARIVAQRNTVFDTLAGELSAMLPNATHSVALDNVPAVLSNISAGANDVTILEYAVAMTLIGLGDDAEFMVLNIDIPFNLQPFQERLGIGVRKGEEELLAHVNQTLANFHYIDINQEFLTARDARAAWMEESIRASLAFQRRLF